MSEAPDQPEPQLPPVLVALFRGVLYREQNPDLWHDMLRLQGQVRDQAALFGLELMLVETDGYAFLRQQPAEEGADTLPRLVPRRPLSYPVSLLLALLRKKLAEHDAGGGDVRLILERDQVVDMLRLFLPETANDARLVDQVDRHLNKIVELGFLRRLRGEQQRFEVQRILASFVDAQWLADFEARLAEYRRYLEGPDASADDD
ncbi:MAG: DUF4194 domain-containing protein [Gammaproteobacteria bacterium]|nr:DUF4194 domain-containing protein [Gammaproteobacteria bacterium]